MVCHLFNPNVLGNHLEYQMPTPVKLEQIDTIPENEYDAMTAMYCMSGSVNEGNLQSYASPGFPSFKEMDELDKRQPKPSYASISLKQMREIMETYGPERILPMQKPLPTTAESTKRKFIRWNPNFFQRFRYDQKLGKYVPLYGEVAERIWRQSLRKKRKEECNKRRSKASAAKL
jgi:hypothetical protein